MTYWVITKDNWFGVSTIDSNFKSTEGYTIFKYDTDIPDLKFNTWDFINQSWVQTVQQKLSRVDFILRFTAIEWAAATTSTDINIQQGLALIQAAEFIDVADMRTQMLVGYCAMIGLITNARVAEILA